MHWCENLVIPAFLTPPSHPLPTDAVASFLIVLIVVLCTVEVGHFCELLAYVKIRPYFPPS